MIDFNFKERVKTILKSNVFEKKVLNEDSSAVSPGTMLSLPIMATGLTFHLEKELLMQQLEHDKFKLEAELEKELTVERMHQETEQAKLKWSSLDFSFSAVQLSRKSSLFSKQSGDNFDVLGSFLIKIQRLIFCVF